MTRGYDLPSRRLVCKDSQQLIEAHCRNTSKTKVKATSKRKIMRSALERAISEAEPDALELAASKRDMSKVARPLTKERLILLNAITEMRMIPMFMVEAVQILRGIETEDYRAAYNEICKRWKSVHKGRDYSDSPVIYYSVLSLLRG